MKDWKAWHQEYDDPASDQSRRLYAVQGLLRDALWAKPPGPIHLTSACAGDGRDVIGVLADHPRAADVSAVLVELDPDLAAAAGSLGRQGDAGLLSTYADVPRADVLLLAGIFGNVSDADLKATVDNASRLCAPGAHVLWTRGRRAPDLTPDIRQWWDDAGWEELGFVSGGEGSWSVGYSRLTVEPLPFSDMRLFTFVD